MATQLPDYVTSTKPVPKDKRTPWYASTAPTYAGIFLWFVFWHQVPLLKELTPGSGIPLTAGGALSQGLGIALLALIVSALICHYLFYLVPGKLGVQTGLPLYVVGTSTYGVQGGFIMPGFLMGVLQFGWLAVNAFFTTGLLCAPFGAGPGTLTFTVVGIAFVLLATLVGLKGIQYVGRIATYLPLLPLFILVVLTLSSIGGLTKFNHKELAASAPAASEGAAANAEQKAEASSAQPAAQAAPLSVWGVFLAISAYVVGFFATAGAAGVDFGMGNRNENDVKWGGLVGIAGAIILTGGLSLIIAAGTAGAGLAGQPAVLQPTKLMENLAPVLGEKTPAVFWYLLAIAAFPPACFSSFIAANSFKTTLPKVNPFVSCGIGALASIALVLSGYAGNAANVFTVIGASFGPVCGAMAADYVLSGNRWAGPRAGFNPAGWISWIAGFVVGGIDLILGTSFVPCPPVAAFIVGFVLYVILAFAGLESQSLEMPREVK
ncbi:MAG: cytosine permease [Thermogutta sp.]